ncbi:helix-turn-helix domain-containing protein [Kordia zhangzhouensis]|uniref:helix-turn-helix domain-containing protein n=1 Tax=Kordia zhangzhouensis TaxID=1620405 RepID=UPI000699DC63|nr:helix-turn-helix transcriptional regulator [Kordia zhangzhouensis]
MEKVANNIKRIREFKNLTQQYVAERLDISQSQYHRIESGDAKVKEEVVHKIAEIFEVEPNQLYSFDESHVFQAHSIGQAINYNSGNIHFYQIDDKLEKLYEDKIALLEAEIERLKKGR